MKNLYFKTVMSVVSDLTELTEEEILNAPRSREIVDARWLAVKLMKDVGLYPAQIAEKMSMTPRTVQYILSNFNDRLRFGDPILKMYLDIAHTRLWALREIEAK